VASALHRFSRRVTARFPVLFAMREAVALGLAAIRAYKLRAGLTILGVVMGIMTVIGMSSVVAGLNVSMAKQIEGFGSSVIFVRPANPGENLSEEERRKRKGITLREVKAIKERAPAVAGISPMEPLFGNVIKYGNESVRDASIFGTTEAYATVHDIYMAKGRFLSDLDVTRGTHVVVLGAAIADTLFPYIDPLDKDVQIDGRRFHVIGVMEHKGKFLWFNRDNFIAVPLGSVQRKDERFDFILADVKSISADKLETAVEQVREAMRRERKLRFWQPDNFGVFTQDTLTDLYRNITGGIYMVMIAISSIGLLVGGVGVMNIMLVSVTERTREIGVRKALGAKRRDILAQFLTEAMTLTGVGGLLGVAVGAGIAWLVNAFSPFPAVLQPFWVILALATAVVVGLVFGLWPAAKAARLDPITALRYE
jgi:putative ABC transport system permease protein